MHIEVYAKLMNRQGCPNANVVHCAVEACRGHGKHLDIRPSPHSIPAGRNGAVRAMLQTSASHLLFIDSDVLVPPNAVTLLLGCNAPVAAGCVPVRVSSAVPVHLNVAPDWNIATGRALWCTDWFSGTKEVVLAGTGCMLIRRDVLEEVGFPWFRWPPDTELEPRHASDDTDFCARITDMGIGPIVAHGDVRCGHLKEIDLRDMMPAAWPAGSVNPGETQEEVLTHGS